MLECFEALFSAPIANSRSRISGTLAGTGCDGPPVVGIRAGLPGRMRSPCSSPNFSRDNAAKADVNFTWDTATTRNCYRLGGRTVFNCIIGWWRQRRWSCVFEKTGGRILSILRVYVYIIRERETGRAEWFMYLIFTWLLRVIKNSRGNWLNFRVLKNDWNEVVGRRILL